MDSGIGQSKSRAKLKQLQKANKRSLPTEKTDNPIDTQLKSSSCERNLTEKGQEMYKQDTKKQEKAFHKAYNSQKVTAREARMKLKTLCSLEDLNKLQLNIETKHDAVRQQYEPILRYNNITPKIANKMDAKCQQNVLL